MKVFDESSKVALIAVLEAPSDDSNKDVAKKLDALLLGFDDAFISSNFQWVADVVDQVDLTKVNSSVICGLLTSTALAVPDPEAAEIIPQAYSRLYERAYAELCSRPEILERIDKVLVGLTPEKILERRPVDFGFGEVPLLGRRGLPGITQRRF
jgi:hypothetical protein